MNSLTPRYAPFFGTRSWDRWLGDLLNDNFFEPPFASDRSGSGVSSDLAARRVRPAYEIQDLDRHYVLSLDMPGVKAEDFVVEVQDQVLTVSANRKWSNEGKNQEETRELHYQRSFSLPENIQADAIEANYENGVLHLAIPKPATSEKRTIKVQTGKSGLLTRLFDRSEKVA